MNALRTLLLAAVAVASSPAHAAPVSDPLASLHQERIDIEIKGAEIGDILLLMGDIIGEPLRVEACVQGRVDLELHHATVRMVLEALAAELELSYSRDAEGALVVGCGTAEGDAEPVVDVQMRAVPVDEVFDVLATMRGGRAQLEGCGAQRVDVELRNAPLDAVISALSAELDAEARWEGDRLRVSCPAR